MLLPNMYNEREKERGLQLSLRVKQWKCILGKSALHHQPLSHTSIKLRLEILGLQMKKIFASLLGNPRSSERSHHQSQLKETRESTDVPQSSNNSTGGLENETTKDCVTIDYENIIWNPCFDAGLSNWCGRGCKILLHNSLGDGTILPVNGNFFASATNRQHSWNGIQQEITSRVQRKIAYEVTAVARILGNVNTADVQVTLWVKAPSGREQYIKVAKMQVSNEEWVELHGKFFLNSHFTKAVISLEGPTLGTDILINSLVVKRMKKAPRSPPPNTDNALFGVNIIGNANLKNGLSQWSPFGSCNLRICSGSPKILPPEAGDSLPNHDPLSGLYIFASNRTEIWMGASQTITDKLQLHLTYKVVAWVSVGQGAIGPESIDITLAIDKQWVNAGRVQVTDGNWHGVGGSFRIDTKPSKVVVYVSGPSPGVDLMVAGLHIFPVDRKARFKYLKEKTDKVRKCDIILKFPDRDTLSMSVKVRQMQNSFPLGSCFNRSTIDNEEFVDFLVKNFNWAVFGNELKWYHTESLQGKYNYQDADELLDFCERHGLQTRGHCIFWEVEDAVQPWIRTLNRDDLMAAVDNRLRSLLTRYKGRLRHYDVNNEMLHGSFFQDRLGEDIRAYMFREAKSLDPSAILFVNDYNVEEGYDMKSTPEMYIEQILDLQERGAVVGGIGLQCHITNPVGEVLCAVLDKLAILGLPIWFTELDVVAENEYDRADHLEIVLREAYAHPAVGGVIVWGFWELFMWRENSHLVDADGEVNEAGRRLLALKREWMSEAEGAVDAVGEFRFRGYEGTYTIEVTTPWKRSVQTFVVEKGRSPVVLNINI